MSSRKWHKKCFVPGCSSNSFDQPLKAFIKLPQGTAVRKQWAEAVGRTGKDVYFNHVSSVYCCGDHFNLEEDAENWLKYRIMGTSIKLKAGVLPRISDTGDKNTSLLDAPCKAEKLDKEYYRLMASESPGHRDSGTIISTETRDDYNIDIKDEPLSRIVKNEPREPSQEKVFGEALTGDKLELPPVIVKTEPNDISLAKILTVEEHSRSYENVIPKNKTLSHKDIQCNISIRKHMRSKATQVDMNILMCSRGTSPIIFKQKK
ncbi:uncharacterized protein LOC124303091 isoform X1 [Neodiprion virginianus]|uniref:uncharacterized protein LOC124180562 isoform X1 n=1 Tax=Neodiprion fabricii TaxID=2872261 RepID=UPI001ED95AB8|nr:uncharacterized protein LOC124180562 isoform X1 [Neodiprion fabricii]XP_046615842.1 uncharacterized protein LOC124303091 isoform X1 [Neodiprion virginianus]